MFCVCNIPNQQDDKFVLFDKEEFNSEDFNIDKVKDITFEELISDYKTLPILSLNDFLLRTLKPKSRTTTHILGECGINSWQQLECEHVLIGIKKSNLSKSQRELVEKRYSELLQV